MLHLSGSLRCSALIMVHLAMFPSYQDRKQNLILLCLILKVIKIRTAVVVCFCCFLLCLFQILKVEQLITASNTIVVLHNPQGNVYVDSISFHDIINIFCDR